MIPTLLKAPVTGNRMVARDTYLLTFRAPEMALAARPGQFVMVRCGRGNKMVTRRPFSIHQVQWPDIALYFAAVGAGTRWLASLKPGDEVDVLGPLGNSFTVRPGARRLLLLAGGAGISPLVFLAAEATRQGHEVRLIHGASTKEQLYPLFRTARQSALPLSQKGDTGPLTDSAKRRGFSPFSGNTLRNVDLNFQHVTEDGSAGRKGLITDYLDEHAPWADQIGACGPVGMYASMEQQKRLWEEKPCQVSLETRMGCGIGACFGCTINTRKGLMRVCRDGPIFELEDLILSEVKV